MYDLKGWDQMTTTPPTPSLHNYTNFKKRLLLMSDMERTLQGPSVNWDAAVADEAFGQSLKI